MLWMHGGGYCFGNALQPLSTLLRVTEVAKGVGVDLDILSIEYTLAPDAMFPQQQEQAVAAYRYLIEDEHIDPGSIIVGGESAGGHLALSCLVGLSKKGTLGQWERCSCCVLGST